MQQQCSVLDSNNGSPCCRLIKIEPARTLLIFNQIPCIACMPLCALQCVCASNDALGRYSSHFVSLCRCNLFDSASSCMFSKPTYNAFARRVTHNTFCERNGIWLKKLGQKRHRITDKKIYKNWWRKNQPPPKSDATHKKAEPEINTIKV